MEAHRHFPDLNRLSVLAATILLAYTTTRFISFPSRDLAFQAPGIYLSFSFDFNTIISLLVAGLAAAGMQWLISDHPGLAAGSHHIPEIRKGEFVPHWLLPALTAWVIGVPLGNLANGIQWWIVFAMGGILFLLVCVAEYIALDPSDIWRPLATAGLTALSFALYLMLAVAIRSGGGRLYLILPSLVLTAGLVVLRTLYLQTNGRWLWTWTAAIAFVVAQIVIGLHYLPFSPVRYGLFLLGPLYALTSLAGTLENGFSLRRGVSEPALMLVLVWGLALWLG
jgi:hypothetical protein